MLHSTNDNGDDKETICFINGPQFFRRKWVDYNKRNMDDFG